MTDIVTTAANTELIVNPQSTELAVHIPMPGGVTLPDNVPDYIRNDLINDPTYDDGMDEYLKIPRIAINQKMTDKCQEIGPEGTLYLSPQRTPLWLPTTKENPAQQPPLIFVPNFFWGEAICWNPRGVQGLSAMRDRSTDRNSELFRRAQSRNPKDKTFRCPEIAGAAADDPKKQCRIQEHLNFIVYLYHSEYMGLPMLLSFSRTSFYTGQNLIQSIKIRKIRSFAQYYGLDTTQISNNDGEWATYRTTPVIDHATGMLTVVDEEWYAWYRQENARHAENYGRGLVQAQYGDEDQGGTENTGPSSADVAAAQARY